MKSFLASFRFLTILPIPGNGDCSEAILHASARYFPLVGAVIGAMMAGIAFGLGFVFPHILVASILALAMIAISGGFHIDGLADTADGFLSSRPPEKIREIMKDSRIGAMGVIAIVSVISLKILALTSLNEQWLWRAAFLAPMAGHTILFVKMTFMSPADSDGGLGSIFINNRKPIEAIAATLLLACTGWVIMGYAALVAIAACLLILALFCLICQRKLSGATGDTLGAACELCELTMILALCTKPVQQLGLEGALL